MADPEPFWLSPRAGNTPMDTYRKHINTTFSQSLRTTKELHTWTISNQQKFWIDLYRYLKIVPPLPKDVQQAYDESLPMSSIPKFFAGHNLNYAENLLFANPDPDAIALIGVREDQDLATNDEERVSWAELREKVRTISSALRRSGIRKGDRVAALVSNSIWAIVLFLATATVGAIFTSINPDLGVEGCVSRLLQVTPKVLFFDGDATYKGKVISVEPKVVDILRGLRHQPMVYAIPIRRQPSTFHSINKFLSTAAVEDKLRFERVSFSYPLVICYSSGTTGAPKCIVHQHGLILQLKKVSTLHNSLTPQDVVLQYSTTTWVVFYIMNGHSSTGATCVCYDGSPMWPDVRQFLRLCEKYRATYLGSSPRYLLELQIAKAIPKEEFDLSALRMVNTTGAPLSVEQYDWFYATFPRTVHLSNTAGGTDTATSLLASDPSGPLHKGEMQMMGLGMDIDIADQETGESILHTGRPGEMVIRKPYPSMPVFFWGDTNGSIYQSAYFERFTNVDVWAQHDWLQYNPLTGGFVMHGRSDGVLNPSGIRFGSGEIYAIVEAPAFNSEIAETLCVGRRRPEDKDEIVLLFVKMLPGYSLNEALIQRIRSAIAMGLSPRHVPAIILAVPDIPVTINGKKVEIAVKQIISGKDVAISSTVANPDTLRSYRKYRNVERSPRGPKL